MVELQSAVDDFLAQRVIAVAGVSRDGNLPANHIFRKLKTAGYEVYPVNPKTSEVEGESCFPDLASVPARIEGVVVATPPSAAGILVDECIRLGIPRVWMHRSFGEGSVSSEAEERCRKAGIALIPGACPMMYLEPVDFAHRCIRWFLKVGRKLPEPSGFSTSS
jgi:predicted CoA-binding protein